MTWSIEDARRLYAVGQWSEGFFDIGEDGRLVATPRRDRGPAICVDDVVAEAQRLDIPLPLLIRFGDILDQRVAGLKAAFASACEAEGYRGDYSVVYPIKVNQRRSVVERILGAGDGVGLEAGSKPELLAVLAMTRPGGIVICNGYKDTEYIRMALIGRRLGLKVYLVVEKLAEVSAIIQIAQQVGIRPWLGVRLRLASIAHGKWQNTGGEKAKFGLSPGQVLEMVDLLRDADMLDCLKLLHFHMGSQISNIRDINLGVREACRYLGELGALGVHIDTMDVGGGLAVDYEGASSRSYFSMNYGLEQYAGAIVRALREGCDEAGLPHPAIISESGRALTAHHAVLVTEVSAVEWVGESQPVDRSGPDAPAVIAGLRQLLHESEQRPPTEVFHEAMHLFADGKEQFVHGVLSLAQRAELDELFFAACADVRRRLNPSRRADQAVRDELRRLMADKYFCNFSIFRSLPDVWAIDQVFPIIPIASLDRRPDRRAVLEDLTCDSDGRIDRYVEADGLEATLPVHTFDPAIPYRLAVLMVGAYQEILGDDHNLFGRTHSVDLRVTDEGYTLSEPIRGDSAAAVLREVGFEPGFLADSLQRKIEAAADLDAAQKQLFLEAARHSLDAYTYLTTDEVEVD